MNRDDVIRWAQDCWPSDRRMWSVDADLPRLERFAALVAAAEREACAKFIEDEYVRQFVNPWREDLAAAIRARGQA